MSDIFYSLYFFAENCSCCTQECLPLSLFGTEVATAALKYMILPTCLPSWGSHLLVVFSLDSLSGFPGSLCVVFWIFWILWCETLVSIQILWTMLAVVFLFILVVSQGPHSRARFWLCLGGDLSFAWGLFWMCSDHEASLGLHRQGWGAPSL